MIKTTKPTKKKRTSTNYYKINQQKDKLNEYKNSLDMLLDELADNVEKSLNIYFKRPDLFSKDELLDMKQELVSIMGIDI